MGIAVKIKDLRKSHKLTQEQFAKSLGISRGYLSCVEIGKTPPTELLINCISLTYSIEKRWLTDDSQEGSYVASKETLLLEEMLKKFSKLRKSDKRLVNNIAANILNVQYQLGD